MAHIAGVTPEAPSLEAALGGRAPNRRVSFGESEKRETYSELQKTTGDEIDTVILGCPHASLAELEAVAGYLGGRQVKATLWITTARATRGPAEEAGLVAQIEGAGGCIVADTCMVVAPVADLGFRTMATNSAKMAFYTPSHSGLSMRFGPMEQCLEAALTGHW